MEVEEDPSAAAVCLNVPHIAAVNEIQRLCYVGEVLCWCSVMLVYYYVGVVLCWCSVSAMWNRIEPE